MQGQMRNTETENSGGWKGRGSPQATSGLATKPGRRSACQVIPLLLLSLLVLILRRLLESLCCLSQVSPISAPGHIPVGGNCREVSQCWVVTGIHATFLACGPQAPASTVPVSNLI